MPDPAKAPTPEKSPPEVIARELLKLFWLERYIFLGLSVLAGLVTVYAGYKALEDHSSVTVFFGSGGVVTFALGRTLAFFDKVTKIAFG